MLEAGRANEFAFSVQDATGCIRAMAAGSATLREVELEVLDADGNVLGADTLLGSVALANLGGPICLAKPGRYRVVVRAREGQGVVALAVWQATAPLPAQGVSRSP
jgi:hypothetical protein